jgi:lipoate-protein ligase A
MIGEAHRHVLGLVARALRTLLPQVDAAGTSDLAIKGRKFSGNSLRLKRDHLLYHGTLLYDFPLEAIAGCLKSPPRQPEYRAGRSHGEFVMNLPLDAAELRSALIETWHAESKQQAWPESRTRRLVAGRYAREEWNLQR